MYGPVMTHNPAHRAGQLADSDQPFMHISSPATFIIFALLAGHETAIAFVVPYSTSFRTLRTSHLYHGSLSVQQRRILSSSSLLEFAPRTLGDVSQCQSRSSNTPEVDHPQKIIAKVEATKAAASGNIKFADDELDNAVRSLQSLADPTNTLDWPAIRSLLAESAHQSHKDWSRTDDAGQRLSSLIRGPEDVSFRKIFARVLEDGNWDGAVAASALRPSSFQPWVVLVTGVNGIRKTTSAYQPWFKAVIQEALGDSYSGPADELPDGGDSFFRQLDYIIATVANEDFRALYALDDVAAYAAAKDAIFARYRTAAEIVGCLLVRAAQRRRANIMIETSGRDPAMFRYVDALFPPAAGYRRLALRFAVADVAFAERSVDARMRAEMRAGRAALARAAAAPAEVVRANAGGPYGAAALRGVEAEAAAVWRALAHAGGGGGGAAGGGGGGLEPGWMWASVAVTADEAAPWTVHAVRRGPGGSESPGTPFAFGPPPPPPAAAS